MNYLAHIHLARETRTSLLGNFLGDFVKGDAYLSLPAELQHGIWLHRKIDIFTDRHPSIKVLNKAYPTHLRRMAGVITDIYFDYLLCQNWDVYCAISLSEVCDSFYQELEHSALFISPRFHHIKTSLLTDKWLDNYQYIHTCLAAFKHIENRLKNRVIFADSAYTYINQHHEFFYQTFVEFYPQLIEYSHTISTIHNEVRT
ncbi:ACP phosphodiesterase [Aestuariibacter sp. AA17]|uniref:ACP phosphodiesterase n=1 Tax=Fluctibacter corallii TaxID=2984329 RepID=A0ABT3AD96_9ALTE|nr:ACP phosphodiesterase [Aestuariibacter sp. AA17]MCV2886282.1 ACP phosphodiesterase [Aestuariibacter sp. AA17]